MVRVSYCGPLTLCAVSLLLSGCDPNKRANKFFTDLGLNRLAILRTDIKPGGVILADNKQTMYAGNVTKYVSALSSKDSADSASSFMAVIPSYIGKDGLDGNASLKFLDSVLPVSISNSLRLNGSVTLNQIQATVQRMEPDDIQAVLNDSQQNARLSAKLQEKWDQNADLYLIYETYSAKKFSLKTVSDSNISPEIDINQTKTISSGTAKLTITHSSNSELTIDTDTSYIFAVRAAKIEPRGGSWRLRVLQTPPAFGLGTKAEGDKYSSLIDPESGTISLLDRPNGLD